MRTFKTLLALTFAVSALSLSTSDATAQTRSAANVEKDLIKAADTAVATYKKTGMAGLAANVQDCYEKQKNKFYCLYLDLASRRIDQIFVEAMHFPPNEFFADEKFGGRIGPVLAKSNMDMDTANQYLATTTPVVNGLVEKRLLGKK